MDNKAEEEKPNKSNKLAIISIITGILAIAIPPVLIFSIESSINWGSLGYFEGQNFAAWLVLFSLLAGFIFAVMAIVFGIKSFNNKKLAIPGIVFGAFFVISAPCYLMLLA